MEDKRYIEVQGPTPVGTQKCTSYWWACCCALKLRLYVVSFGIYACKCGHAVRQLDKILSIYNFKKLISSHLKMLSCLNVALMFST